jgi:hypothetical protein
MRRVAEVWRAGATRWVLLGVVGLLLGMDYYGVSVFPKGPVNTAAVGDIATWVTGAATASAVVVAGLALRHEQLRIQQDRKRKELESAGDLYAWTEQRRLRPGEPTSVLILMNRTSYPVYSWKIFFDGQPDIAGDDAGFGPLLPGERVIELASLALSDAVRRGIPRPTIRFVTVTGSVLERNFSGSLSEVNEA